MASINMSSIISKAKASLANNKLGVNVELAGNKEARAIVQAAGQDLVAALNREIGATGKYAGAIGNASIASVSVNGTTGIVEINIDKNHRPSLWPEGYPNGCDDMASLFNNGYNARDYVYGDHKGKRIRSRKSMHALNFVNKAVSGFGPSGGQYKVISIEIGERFGGGNGSG